MKMITRFTLLAAAPLALAACDSAQENNAEDAGDDMQAQVEQQADAMEDEAAAMRDADADAGSATAGQADALDNQANVIREQAEDKSQAMEEQAEDAANKR
jgi:hypothetical protein